MRPYRTDHPEHQETMNESPLTHSSPFDGVQRDPINRQASMMLSKGVKAPRARMGTMTHWEVCPPLHRKQAMRDMFRTSGDDLTGRRRGRMVAVGLSKAIKARWVMRCDCGNYEPRTAKSIKNPNNTAESCSKCRQVEQAKRCHHYHATGRNL